MSIDYQTYNRGEAIYEAGEKAEYFYMIVSGEIAIVREMKDVDGMVWETLLLNKLEGWFYIILSFFLALYWLYIFISNKLYL